MYFEPELLAAIDQYAGRRGRGGGGGRSAVIRALVRQGLVRLRDVDPDVGRQLADAETRIVALEHELAVARRQLQPDLRVAGAMKTPSAILRFAIPEYMAATAEKAIRESAEARRTYAQAYLPPGARRKQEMAEVGAQIEQAKAFGQMVEAYERRREGQREGQASPRPPAPSPRTVPAPA